MLSSLRGAGWTLLRRTLYPALAETWAVGFAAAGRLRHAALPPWTPLGGGPVGIVAPHPDDETGGCGGVICLQQAAGDAVSVLILTDGGASRALGLPRAALVALRATEARAAARTLGLARLDQAGLAEGAWDLPAGAARLAGWFTNVRPALLYAPSCVDYHPEHRRVAQALAAALRTMPAAQQPRVRIYEVFVPLGPGLVNCVAGIASVYTTKQRALACYASQAPGLAQVPRRDRYLARFYGLPHAAEAFCDLSAPAYIALITQGALDGRAVPFRSLRPRPFTDPLAYLIGARERRRLRRVIRAASNNNS